MDLYRFSHFQTIWDPGQVRWELRDVQLVNVQPAATEQQSVAVLYQNSILATDQRINKNGRKRWSEGL